MYVKNKLSKHVNTEVHDICHMRNQWTRNESQRIFSETNYTKQTRCLKKLICLKYIQIWSAFLIQIGQISSNDGSGIDSYFSLTICCQR